MERTTSVSGQGVGAGLICLSGAIVQPLDFPDPISPQHTYFHIRRLTVTIPERRPVCAPFRTREIWAGYIFHAIEAYNGLKYFKYRGMNHTVNALAGDEVTVLLKSWCEGDESALNKVIPLVYDELRRIAHYQIRREREGHTLQSNALVNEAYLRLIGYKQASWHDRSHFFSCAAQLMRRILVDHARGRCRTKRGGDIQKVALNPSMAIASDADTNLALLDDALSLLAEVDARKAKVVEMRFFGGFSIEEIAEALGISVRTVMNDWKFAKVWLLRELECTGTKNGS